MSQLKRVVIIDYGIGNVGSVKNALAILSVDALVTSDPETIKKATHIILPGVGSFGDGMRGLEGRNLVDVLYEEVMEKKKPILGICLGMQLFATEGFEFVKHRGLNFIKGKVLKVNTGASGYRLPHIGWNNVRVVTPRKLTIGFELEPIFYFVHSFHLVPEDKNTFVGICDYGEEIVAMVERENIFGTQFHPEKSHTDGLQIFKNFLAVF